MTEFAVFLFAAAFGFAVSGTLSSGYALLAGRPLDFKAGKTTVFGSLFAVAMVMFSGPMIVVAKVVQGRRADRFGMPLALCGAALSLFWSFVAGLFYLNLMLSL